MKKFFGIFKSKPWAYVFYALNVAAFAFLYSASWAYGWIADIYPLGKAFIPVLFGIITLCFIFNLTYLLITIFAEPEGKWRSGKALAVIHGITSVLAVVFFFYTLVILFGIDGGFRKDALINGMQSMGPNWAFLCLLILMPLACYLSENPKKAFRALAISGLVGALTLTSLPFKSYEPKQWEEKTCPSFP